MPLWGVHIAIGVVGQQLGFKGIFNKWWKTFIFIPVIAGLPDIVDFSFGFILTDANSVYDYHYGITHTLYFAIVAGFFVSRIIPQEMSWLSWQNRRVNFFFCFSMISLHSLADFISNKQIARFFHPLGASLPGRDLDIMDFWRNFFAYDLEDVKTVAICLGIIALIHFAKLVFKRRWIVKFAVWANMFKK